MYLDSITRLISESAALRARYWTVCSRIAFLEYERDKHVTERDEIAASLNADLDCIRSLAAASGDAAADPFMEATHLAHEAWMKSVSDGSAVPGRAPSAVGRTNETAAARHPQGASGPKE